MKLFRVVNKRFFNRVWIINNCDFTCGNVYAFQPDFFEDGYVYVFVSEGNANKAKR